MIKNPLLPSNEQVVNPENYVSGVIQAVISIFLIVGVIYFLWHFVFSGYHMIASNGDPKKFETAKDGLVWSIMGIIVIFSVFALIRLIGVVVGIPSLGTLQLNFPAL